MKQLSWWDRVLDSLFGWIIMHTPRKIVYYYLLHGVTHATSVYHSIEPDQISVMDMLDAWGRES